jgi:uncharacterized membrane protein
MKFTRLSFVLGALSLAGIAVAYRFLPPIIPIHWGVDGEVNGTAPRAFIFFLGAMPLFLTGFMAFLPKIDPRAESYARHEKSYDIVIFAITLVMIAVGWIIVAAATNIEFDVVMISSILVGALFVVLGNVMPRFRPNYTLGIRTPWALADEETWRKTHRMGGYAFIGMGLCFIVPPFLPVAGIVKWSVALSLFAILLVAIFVYSWAVFPKGKKTDEQ